METQSISLESSNDMKMKIPTSISEDETDTGGDKYFSLALWSLAITDGRVAENPGMCSNIQINSFSIKYKSWLLHNEMINSVCRSEKVQIMCQYRDSK